MIFSSLKNIAFTNSPQTKNTAQHYLCSLNHCFKHTATRFMTSTYVVRKYMNFWCPSWSVSSDCNQHGGHEPLLHIYSMKQRTLQLHQHTMELTGNCFSLATFKLPPCSQVVSDAGRVCTTLFSSFNSSGAFLQENILRWRPDSKPVSVLCVCVYI